MKTAFINKINALLTEKENLVNLALGETRDLNADENSRIEAIDNEVNGLKDMVAQMPDVAPDNGVKEPVVDPEVQEIIDGMNEDELREFILDRSTKEERASKYPDDASKQNKLDDDNKAIVPDTIAQGVLAKMEEHSTAFALAKKFPSVNGTYALTADIESDAHSVIVAEGDEFTGFKKLSFTNIHLEELRLVAGYILTQQIKMNSQLNVVQYCMNKLADKHARGFEKQIFQGKRTHEGDSTNKEFRGLDAFKNDEVATAGGPETSNKGKNIWRMQETVCDVKAVAGSAGYVRPDQLITMMNLLHPKFTANAKWFMTRTYYNMVCQITKEGAADEAQFLVQNGMVNGKLTRTLFGYPIEITQEMSADFPCYFGDMSEAYGIMIKKGMKLDSIFGDTTQAVRGTHLLMLDIYADGAVINPEAIVRGKKAV